MAARWNVVIAFKDMLFFARPDDDAQNTASAAKPAASAGHKHVEMMVRADLLHVDTLDVVAFAGGRASVDSSSGQRAGFLSTSLLASLTS